MIFHRPHTPYSVLHTAYLLLPILYTLYSLLYTYSPVALASTDPQSSTPSATATIPSTAATSSDSQAPTAPILIRPVDGTTTSDPRPEFVWRRSSDPNGNTVIYTLYLNGTATHLGISDSGNSSRSNYTARIENSEIKLLPSVSLTDGVYRWYVTASDPSGNSAQSAAWTLTIDTVAPSLTLLDLDTYHNPSIAEGSNFDIAGPKDVYFTVLSDPFVDIQITLTPLYSIPYTPYTIHSTTNSQGLAYLYQHLTPGKYTISIVAIDRGNNTTALPSFTVTVTQAQITVPLPPLPGLPASYSIPYTIYTIPSLPATIAKIETRLPLAYLTIGLLALTLAILLIFLWKRKYNLILVNSDGVAISEAVVYHSIPTTHSHYTPILVTKFSPISYLLEPNDHGRLYIPRLNRYSTLTIRLDSRTYILSLSAKRKLYTIVLG